MRHYLYESKLAVWGQVCYINQSPKHKLVCNWVSTKGCDMRKQDSQDTDWDSVHAMH